MKIKFIGSGTFISKGIRFEQNAEIDVDDTVYQYLTKSFPSRFVEVAPEVAPEETPEEVVEVEVVEPTRKHKSKKTTPVKE